MSIAEKSDVRLDFRLTRPLKELIEQAAVLTGQTVSDFAVSVLTEQARRVIRENSLTVLSDRDRDLFLNLLDSDAAPNAALKRAAKKYRARHG